MFSRKELIETMLRAEDSTLLGKKGHLFSVIEGLVGNSEDVLMTLRNFLGRLKKLERKHKNSLELVLLKEDIWCGYIYNFAIGDCSPPTPSGRPPAPDSGRAKKRRLNDIRTSNSSEDLLLALCSALTLKGHRKAANMIKEIAMNPEVSHSYSLGKKMFEEGRDSESNRMSTTSALAMFAEADLTKNQYMIIKRYVGHPLPNYNMILAEKKKCYPPEEATTVTEVSAEYNLQDLVDITTKRLLIAHPIEQPTDNKGLEFFWKWGMDGSSGLSNHNQLYDDHSETASRAADSGVFMVTCVPLRLSSMSSDQNPTIVWKNPKISKK